MKKIIAVMIAALMTAGIMTGCNNNENGENTDKATSTIGSETTKQVDDNSLNNVIEKGKFVLGLDDSFPPMGYRNDDNKIVGFDIDCAEAVCEKLGVKLELQPISWDAKQMELDSGNIDCIWNGLSIDEERKQAMNLSEPYMKNRMVLVVTNDSGYKSQADLSGKKIGVQSGSTADKTLEDSEFFKTIGKDNKVSFEDNVTAFMDLETKGIDAVFVDEVVANNFIKEKEKPFTVLEDGALSEEEYAIGFRKNDQALRDAVQSALSELKADGTLAEISKKWFGKDVTTVK